MTRLIRMVRTMPGGVTGPEHAMCGAYGRGTSGWHHVTCKLCLSMRVSATGRRVVRKRRKR